MAEQPPRPFIRRPSTIIVAAIVVVLLCIGGLVLFLNLSGNNPTNPYQKPSNPSSTYTSPSAPMTPYGPR